MNVKESALGRSIPSNIQSPDTESVSNLLVQVVLERGIDWARMSNN